MSYKEKYKKLVEFTKSYKKAIEMLDTSSSNRSRQYIIGELVSLEVIMNEIEELEQK